jgi:transposase
MHSKTLPRRRHSNELKTQVLAECDAPGASVAAVAQAHGLNANLVHKWRRGRGSAAVRAGMPVVEPLARAPVFVPLSLPAPPTTAKELPEASTPAAATCREIRLELKRGALEVGIAWPIAQAGECAAWLRELLR